MLLVELMMGLPVDIFCITHLSNADKYTLSAAGKCWQIQTLERMANAKPSAADADTDGGCVQPAAGADNEVLTTKCWQRSADKAPWEFVPYQLTPYAITPWVFTLGVCLLYGYRYTHRVGCSRVADAQWCSPISSLVGSAIGCSAASQSAKQCGGGMLYVHTRGWSTFELDKSRGACSRRGAE